MKHKDIIYIGGNRWELLPLTPKLNNKFLKLLKDKRKGIWLRGFCDAHTRTLYVRPGQQPEDHANTLLHEGLHALLWEVGCVHGLSHARTNEKTIETLTREILGFLKQVDLMPA